MGMVTGRIIFQLLMNLGFVLLSFNSAKCQFIDTTNKGLDYIGQILLYQNHDTNYIKNYSQKYSVKLVSINKYNLFRILDRNNKSRLMYRPIRDVSLGVGFSHKWFALDITFSLGLQNRTDFDNTRSFDFQGSLFSSKQFISFTIQYYQAYQLANLKGVYTEIPENSKRREDLRTIHIGLKYMFATNFAKFSIKAPFVLNESQRRSAGSPIVGASFNMFVMDADSSIVPPEASDYFEPRLQMNDLNILNGSVSLGYMYTFVYKKRFFLTLSLIPGLNINGGDYFTTDRHYFAPNFFVKLNSMNAIGYNSSRFFAGFQFLADSYYSRFGEKTLAQIGHGKISFFIGYRFGNSDTI